MVTNALLTRKQYPPLQRPINVPPPRAVVRSSQLVRRPQLVSQSVVSQQSEMPVVRSPQQLVRSPQRLQGKQEELAAPTSPSTDIWQRRPPFPHIIRKIRCNVPGDQHTHVPTNACINRDILFPVRARIANRTSDDTGSSTDLPQHLPAASGNCLEPPVESPIE